MFKMDNDPRIIGSEKGLSKGIPRNRNRSLASMSYRSFIIFCGDMSLREHVRADSGRGCSI